MSKLTTLRDVIPRESTSFLSTATKSVSDSDSDDELDINVTRFAAIVALICSVTSVVVLSR